jgi:hypothetical protein
LKQFDNARVDIVNSIHSAHGPCYKGCFIRYGHTSDGGIGQGLGASQPRIQ